MIDDGPLVRRELPGVPRMFPHVLGDRLLEYKKSVHHAVLTGPPDKKMRDREEGEGEE